MNRYEYSDEQIRSPLRTIAVCVIVLFLGSLLCCVGSARGASPKRPEGTPASSQFPISTPEKNGMDSELLVEVIDDPLEQFGGIMAARPLAATPTRMTSVSRRARRGGMNDE